MPFEERLFQLLEHLRNGAIIVGDYPWCQTFRLTCLQEANKIYTEDIVSHISTLYQGTKTQRYINIFEDYLRNGCLLVGAENGSGAFSVTSEASEGKPHNVVGRSPQTFGNDWEVDVNMYCQLCTHRACYIFCDDILGQLIYDGFVKETNQLLNLADLCAIIQQQIIRPDVFNNCGERVKRIHAQIGGNPPRF